MVLVIKTREFVNINLDVDKDFMVQEDQKLCVTIDVTVIVKHATSQTEPVKNATMVFMVSLVKTVVKVIVSITFV